MKIQWGVWEITPLTKFPSSLTSCQNELIHVYSRAIITVTFLDGTKLSMHVSGQFSNFPSFSKKLSTLFLNEPSKVINMSKIT